MLTHMPDLGYEVEDVNIFHWKISNWNGLNNRITSPEFSCGGHEWYVNFHSDCQNPKSKHPH
jgi:ubiquitin carboxyl-terminal hydrolase 7